MASCLISDAPYATWLSDVLATLEEHKVTKIAVAAPLPGGKVFTGYFDMGTMDKALMATNIQADATMDAISSRLGRTPKMTMLTIWGRGDSSVVCNRSRWHSNQRAGLLLLDA